MNLELPSLYASSISQYLPKLLMPYPLICMSLAANTVAKAHFATFAGWLSNLTFNLFGH